MKKIISIFLVTFLVASIAFAATPGFRLSPGIGENKTTAQGGQQSTPGKTFRLVRYVPLAGTINLTALSPECIVVWDIVSDDGVTVTTTTTSPDSAVAGVTVLAALTPESLGNTAAQDRSKRNWTWLQTHGLAEVRVNAFRGVSAGDAMGTSQHAGEAGRFHASTSDARKEGNAGFFYDDASANDNDVECFIKCE